MGVKRSTTLKSCKSTEVPSDNIREIISSGSDDEEEVYILIHNEIPINNENY
eukprot:Pgem_evm1s7478